MLIFYNKRGFINFRHFGSNVTRDHPSTTDYSIFGSPPDTKKIAEADGIEHGSSQFVVQEKIY